MTRTPQIVAPRALVAALIGLLAIAAVRAQDGHAIAQAVAEANDLRGPFPASPVSNAPFTAEATLKVIETTKAGTTREWNTARRIYRDATGRARVDYEAPLPDGRMRTVAVILTELVPRPGRVAFMIDSHTRTIRPLPRDLMNGQFSGWAHFDIPRGLADFQTFALDTGATADVEAIGEQRLEGLRAIGWRLGGNADPSRPDERWESPELKMVLRAHFIDGRTHAEIDYRLTNIHRIEPDARLFDIPTDYTRVTSGPLIGQPGDPLYRSGGGEFGR